MIDWIHEGCKHWGWQMRMLYVGKDGWPSRTMLARMIEEGALGASASRFMQHFPECIDAEALKFNNAIKRLGEKEREILFIDYVVIGKGKVKAVRMGIARSTYFDRRDDAHKALSAELGKPDTKQPKSPDAGQKNQIVGNLRFTAIGVT
jgi:hypothetical protein